MGPERIKISEDGYIIIENDGIEKKYHMNSLLFETPSNGRKLSSLEFIAEKRLRDKVKEETGLYFAQSAAIRDIEKFEEPPYKVIRFLCFIEVQKSWAICKENIYRINRSNQHVVTQTYDSLHLLSFDRIENEYGRDFFEAYYDLWEYSEEKEILDGLKVGDLVVPRGIEYKEYLFDDGKRVAFKVIEIYNGAIKVKMLKEGEIEKITYKNSNFSEVYFNIAIIDRLETLYTKWSTSSILIYHPLGEELLKYMASLDLFNMIL